MCIGVIQEYVSMYQIAFVGVTNEYFLHEKVYCDNNINSQLDTTITNFIDNYNQFNMFQVIISPILRSTRQLVVQCTGALYHKL